MRKEKSKNKKDSDFLEDFELMAAESDGDVDKYLEIALNMKEPNTEITGFIVMLGFHLINIPQSEDYIYACADVLSRMCLLSRDKVLHTLKTNSKIYHRLLGIKCLITEKLINVHKEKGDIHDVLDVLMGGAVSYKEEYTSEHGSKITKSRTRKWSPALAQSILNGMISPSSNISSRSTDLTDDNVIPLLKESSKVTSLISNAKMKNMLLRFDKQQKEALDYMLLHNCPEKITSLGGAVRCGKSEVQVWATLLRMSWHASTSITEMQALYKDDMSKDRKKGDFVFMGKTAPSAYNNIFSIIRSFDLKLTLPASRSFLWKVLNYEIRITGCGKLAVEAIKGSTLDILIIDEAENLEREHYEVLIQRVSNPWSWCVITHNPKMPAFWLSKLIYRDEETRKKAHIRHFNFSLKECEFADPKYVQMLTDTYGEGSPQYTRFVLGYPASISGQVYSQFNEDSCCIHIDPKNYGKYDNIYFGMDVGYNSPAVYIAIGVYRDKKGRLCCDAIDELYHARGHGEKTTQTQYMKMLESFSAPFRDKLKCIFIPHDGGSIKSSLRDLYPIGNTTKKLSVLEGIGLVNTLLTDGRLKISHKCKNLINELYLYRYDETKDHDAVIKTDDHCCDALRYAITSSGCYDKNTKGRFSDLYEKI